MYHIVEESREVWSYFKKVVYNVFFISLVVNAMVLISSFYSYYVLNTVFTTKDINMLILPTIGVVIIYLLIYALNNSRVAALESLAKYFQYGLCDKFLAVGVVNNFKIKNTLPAKKLLQDVKIISEFLCSKSKVLFIFDAPFAVLFVFILGYVSYVNSLFYFLFFFLCLLFVVLRYYNLVPNKDRTLNLSKNFLLDIDRYLYDYNLIKISSLYKTIANKIINTDYQRYKKHIINDSVLSIDLLWKILLHLTQVAIFLNSILLLVNGKINFPAFIISSIVSQRGLSLCYNFVTTFDIFFESKNAVWRMFDSINQVGTLCCNKALLPVDDNNLSIKFIGVSCFLKNNVNIALNNINFALHYANSYLSCDYRNFAKLKALVDIISENESVTSGYVLQFDSSNSQLISNIIFYDCQLSYFDLYDHFTIKDYISLYCDLVNENDMILLCNLFDIDKIISSLNEGYNALMIKIPINIKMRLRFIALLMLRPKNIIFYDVSGICSLYFSDSVLQRLLFYCKANNMMFLMFTKNKMASQSPFDYLLNFDEENFLHVIKNVHYGEGKN
jgi:ABC-type protease/lipase transport system fused ATPase/permease subunit